MYLNFVGQRTRPLRTGPVAKTAVNDATALGDALLDARKTAVSLFASVESQGDLLNPYPAASVIHRIVTQAPSMAIPRAHVCAEQVSWRQGVQKQTLRSKSSS